jgi:DNA-binding response OmpR family regulator
LVHKLKKEGLDVTRFDNGQDAYQAALAETPDLVILDVKMPGLDGFEVLERLRGDARFAKTPILMLTSMGQEADVVRGFGLGADDYILKPFSPVELAARVRRLLMRGRSRNAS